MRRGRILVITFIIVAVVSCTKGLDPIPSDIKNLTMSLSFPVVNGKVGVSDTYYIGAPNINIGEDVPDWAKHDTIFYTDTLPLDLYQIYEKSSSISYLAFKVNVWNEFPVSAVVDMYIIDSSGNTIFAFWENNPFVIPKGAIFANGKVFKPSYQGSTISFNAAQIESLRNAQNIIIHAKIGLKGYKSITFFQYFNNYHLTCEVGARVDFILNEIQ